VKKNIRMIKSGLWILLAFQLAGCGDKFWDPTQLGRFRETPAVNVILDSLGVAEETPSTWEGAEEPRPADVIAYETDYTFSPGDIVRVSIFELLQERTLYTNDFYVTETGKISIPEVGVIEVAGLTEPQLEDRIYDELSPGLLRDPSVSVVMIDSEKRMFSIKGQAVNAPGRYPIPRNSFRLNDALALSRAETQFNVSYVYVSRDLTGSEAESEPGGGEIKPAEQLQYEIPEDEMLEIIAPRAQKPSGGNEFVITSSEMGTASELPDLAAPEGLESVFDELEKSVDVPAERVEDVEDLRWEFHDNQWIQVGVKKPKPSEKPLEKKEEGFVISEKETIAEPIEEKAGRIEWIFDEEENKWVPVQVGEVPPEVKVDKRRLPESGVLKEKAPEDFLWDQIGTGGVQTRVIRIPTEKLMGGDPRYNIMIRPGDIIEVPVDVIGEFYIMGNVNNQGVVVLTGRPMTLKMAIAAAGGLGPLAWPKRCEVARRIGKNKEEIVMVDLDKIASGEQPDFFIKHHDLINVGTHPTARWRAVLRNAFRATYGFGFIYDRNFADRDFGTRRPIPNWF
jgi:protein involved in polysaccharide export with SLBB domain